MAGRRTLRRPSVGSFEIKPYDTKPLGDLGSVSFVELEFPMREPHSSPTLLGHGWPTLPDHGWPTLPDHGSPTLLDPTCHSLVDPCHSLVDLAAEPPTNRAR